MSQQIDVVGLGACSIDYIGVVDSFPKPDTKNRMSRIHVQGGGPVATALVTLARLGSSAAYLGKLGTTPFAQMAIDGFAAEGVVVDHIIRSDEGAEPYFAFVAADQSSGERTIWYSDQNVSRLLPVEVPKKIITSARCLVLDEYERIAAITAAKWAKKTGVLIELDCENPETEGLEELIRHTDVLIVPESFALDFSNSPDVESAGHWLKDLGPRIVAITQGNRGSFCLNKTESVSQPIFDVDTVDTTGCGDVFHGAFTHGLLQGWSLKTVAEFATAVSSLKSCKVGGREGIPTYPDVVAFLSQRGSKEIRAVTGV